MSPSMVPIVGAYFVAACRSLASSVPPTALAGIQSFPIKISGFDTSFGAAVTEGVKEELATHVGLLSLSSAMMFIGSIRGLNSMKTAKQGKVLCRLLRGEELSTIRIIIIKGTPNQFLIIAKRGLDAVWKVRVFRRLFLHFKFKQHCQTKTDSFLLRCSEGYSWRCVFPSLAKNKIMYSYSCPPVRHQVTTWVWLQQLWVYSLCSPPPDLGRTIFDFLPAS